MPAVRRDRSEDNCQVVRLVRRLRTELGTGHGTAERAASNLDHSIESVRVRAKKADVDEGRIHDPRTRSRMGLHAMFSTVISMPFDASVNVQSQSYEAHYNFNVAAGLHGLLDASAFTLGR